MFWYLLALVLSMRFASAAQNLKGKNDLHVDGGSFHFHRTYVCLMVLAFLPLFTVAALRYEVGTDWPIYLDYYNWINDGTKSFSEVLFNLMNKLAFRIAGDFQGMVVLVAFLSYFFLFKAIEEQSISFPLSLLIYFVSTLFFASMNQLRQAITMPIMAPFSDMIEISRQTTVLAFQFGDGFTNMLYPTNPLLMITLGVTVVSYPKWFKWSIPLQLFMLGIQVVFLLIAVLMLSLFGCGAEV